MQSIETLANEYWGRISRRPWILSIGMFAIAMTIYGLTLSPGLSWGGGDFARFQTNVFSGELEGNVFGHPMYVILARPFTWLPIGDVAYRVNLASAVFGAAALVFVFQSAWLLTRSTGASFLATGALLISHTYWTYAVLPKPYSLNALLLAISIYLLLAWRDVKRGIYLYYFALLIGLSLLNHLILLITLPAYAVYILLIVQRDRDSEVIRSQVIKAGILFIVGLVPYLTLLLLTGNLESTSGTISSFLRGFYYGITTPEALRLWLGTSIGLLVYQFFVTLLISIFGFWVLWRRDRPAAVLFGLLSLGIITFLLGATDPRTGGSYTWNLHYYLLMYLVFALCASVGFAELWPRISLTRRQKTVTVIVILALPILIYLTAPVLARSFIPELPGIRNLAGRDNFTYILSPWKQNETGPRIYAENILSQLPSNSILFADYSIWSMIDYLQVVEGYRRDVEIVNLPGAGSGEQLPLVLAHKDKDNLFLGDIGRYYDLQDLENHFDILQTGLIYHLIDK